jgi:hypothetical protein
MATVKDIVGDSHFFEETVTVCWLFVAFTAVVDGFPRNSRLLAWDSCGFALCFMVSSDSACCLGMPCVVDVDW